MNLNKALIFSFFLLCLLALVTVINISKFEKDSQEHYDNDILLANIHCVPEIVRSYEKIKDIYCSRNVLFFRYAKNICTICNDVFLTEILSLQEEIGKEHVLIFSAYPDDRSSRIQLINELAKYNYKNIPVDSLLIPTYKGEQRSYFAYVNNKGELEMVFIPDRSNVHYVREYFLEVKRLLQMAN